MKETLSWMFLAWIGWNVVSIVLPGLASEAPDALWGALTATVLDPVVLALALLVAFLYVVVPRIGGRTRPTPASMAPVAGRRSGDN